MNWEIFLRMPAQEQKQVHCSLDVVAEGDVSDNGPTWRLLRHLYISH